MKFIKFLFRLVVFPIALAFFLTILAIGGNLLILAASLILAFFYLFDIDPSEL